MIIPKQSISHLNLFLLMSVGIHTIGFAVFSFFPPKLIQERYVQVSIKLGGSVSPSLQKKAVPEMPLPVPKNSPTQDKVIVKKTELPKVIQKKITPKVIQKITSTKVVPQEVIRKKVTPKTVSTQEIVQEVDPKIELTKLVQQEVDPKIIKNNELRDELDNLLNKKTPKISKSDFLADATWSGSPRKTLSFPNLTSSIPQHYKTRGYGFSVTAKITFSPQGWVSSVELLRTSGDPRIDSVFRTELRKIRIEGTQKRSYDTITKTFTVSVK